MPTHQRKLAKPKKVGGGAATVSYVTVHTKKTPKPKKKK